MTQQQTYRRYLLGVLAVILFFNYLDRIALGTVLENIKTDLHLSDTQLGFLTGIAFALFYSIVGIPIARWADRGNRVLIISLATLISSAAVMLCGTVQTFEQLLLVRIAVSIGEAGCVPPGSSLVADYFSRAERPRAIAIYGMGGALSVVAGFFLGGWLNELYGWRTTFMLLGAPGLLLALVAWLSLREPRRFATHAPASRAELSFVSDPCTPPPLRKVASRLWSNTTFRYLLLCLAALIFFTNGIGLWLPSFFVRSYGLGTGEIGTWLAVVYGVGALVGSYVGGDLASRFAPNNERLQLIVVAATIGFCGIVLVLAFLSRSPILAFALMGLQSFGLSACNGPLFGTIQTLVPERMRAISLALVYFFANLVGMGLGPLATGTLSDALTPWTGTESLRYALLLLSPGFCWAAWYAWRASQAVTGDLATLDAADGRDQGQQRAVTASAA